VGLGSLKATLSRLAEALGCASVGLHLRHCILHFTGLATYRNVRPLQAGYALCGYR
jgi:hypothetical protein